MAEQVLWSPAPDPKVVQFEAFIQFTESDLERLREIGRQSLFQFRRKRAAGSTGQLFSPSRVCLLASTRYSPARPMTGDVLFVAMPWEMLEFPSIQLDLAKGTFKCWPRLRNGGLKSCWRRRRTHHTTACRGLPCARSPDEPAIEIRSS